MADDKIVRAPSALESRMAIVEARRDKITAFLAPLGRDTARFLTQVRFAMLKSPDLQTCEPESILECAVQAAELGIAPDGTLGSGWMVPFNDKRRGKIAVLIPGYRGLIDLAVRSGAVLDIDATIVHARDGWDHGKGDAPRLVHEPYTPKIFRWEPRGDDVIAYDAADQELDLDPGPMVRAYAVATMRGGVRKSLVMELRDLINRRNRAASYRNRNSAWHSSEVQVREAMFRKIPIRAICNLLPLSPGENTRLLQKALDLEDADVEPDDAVASPPKPRTSRVRAAVEGEDVVDATATPTPPSEPEPGSGG